MLEPDSRTVAFELLRAPPGYDLDFALLTTYTLDLEALLALPLSVVSRAHKGIEDLLADPLLLLEALRQAGERIHLFVDRTGIAIPRARRELYAMLEPSIHSVRAREEGGAFHPKVWVARFTAGDERPLLRVAILSRNLTFDRSWDIALASEATPNPKRPVSASRSLAELIRALPDLSVGALKPSVSEQIRTLADQVGRTPFPAPDGFFDAPIQFHVLGLTPRRSPWCPFSGGYRTLAIAPFINRTGLDSIARMADRERILVSSQEALDKLHDDALAAWNRVYTLSDAALDEPEDEAANRPTGLHAKMLAVEHGWDVTWYVGSANLTAAALTGRNVEVMAAITARKGRSNGTSGQGIDRFLEAGFDMLCTAYHRRQPEIDDPEAVDALRQLEATRDALLDADLKVICSACGEDWKWKLQGTITLPSRNVEVTAWPISIAEEYALPLQLPLILTLPIQRLTSLVAFRLHVPVEAVDDIGLTLRLAVEGMPVDRLHYVLVSLISDRQRFLAFLRALLGGLEGMVDWAKGEGGENDGAGWSIELSEESLLEDLVRAASRDPGRLEPVRRLIDDFRKTEQGRRIVPDDFFGVWTAVDEVIRERMRP